MMMEEKYEFEERADHLYTTTIAILRDIKNSIKDVDNLNTILDLITSVFDEDRWNELVKSFKKVDYSGLVEEDDATDFQGEVACAGGSCEIDINTLEHKKAG